MFLISTNHIQTVVPNYSEHKQMKRFLKIAIEDLKERKQKEFEDHEKTIMSIIDVMLPKQSKILSTNLVKKIYDYDNELNIVLVGHLYLEKLLNDILSKNLIRFETLEKRGILNSFYKKVIYLKSEEITPPDLLHDILIFNKLRNKYAHKLNYDIIDFDMFEFSFLKEYSYDFNIRSKKGKRTLNRILIRHTIYHLMNELTEAHGFLHLLDEN